VIHRRRPRAGIAAAALALLLAPAASAQPRGDAAPASAYFPLVSGMRWVYRESLAPFRTRRVVVTALGTRHIHGIGTPVFVFEEQGDRPFLGIDDHGLLGFLVEDGFVVRFSALGEDSRGELRLFGEEGVRVLPVAPLAGQRWEQLAHLFAVPGADGAAREWTAELERQDSIRVRAGRFRDVVKVVMHYRDPDLPEAGPQITFEDYYAAGVGLVRSIARNHERGSWRRIERELVEFHAPAASTP
jgi:hypothetical protein